MSQNDRAQLRMVVRGRVQGVFFRASAAAQARALGLTGFALNRPDGTVELVAEGARRNLERFMEWARVGPAGARVDEIGVEWSAANGQFDHFAIR